MHAAPGCLVVSVHTRRDLDAALDDAGGSPESGGDD